MSIQVEALNLLEVFDERDRRHEIVNGALCSLNPDFPMRVSCVDGEVFRAMSNLLDSVLGDEVASYYLNEARNMKDGGAIIVDGNRWPIKSVGDVRAYVFRDK